MELGLIGCGNMGTALVSGVLKSGLVMPGEIYAFDIDRKKRDAISEKWGAQSCENIEELASRAKIILLAIKPQDISATLTDYADLLDKKDGIFVSIAAGVPVSLYRDFLHLTRMVRVMPNTPALIGEGAAALFFDGKFGDDEKRMILKIFESCGMATEVKKESLLDIVTGLSGSGPAYVFSFINSLADGGVMEGLPRETARRLAIQTVLGAAKLAQASTEDGLHLEELKDKVTSPGGTTAAGLFVLEKNAFRATVMEAVSSASRRSRELGKKE